MMATRDSISLRPAVLEDGRRVWEWRNEPAARQASFHTEEIRYADHEQWFARRLVDGRIRFFIVLDPQGVEVGYVRFDQTEIGVEISISLDPRARGRGYGSEAIRQGCAAVLASGAPCILARIKPGNTTSVAAFSAAGFIARGTVRISGVEALEMVYPPGGG